MCSTVYNSCIRGLSDWAHRLVVLMLRETLASKASEVKAVLHYNYGVGHE